MQVRHSKASALQSVSHSGDKSGTAPVPSPRFPSTLRKRPALDNLFPKPPKTVPIGTAASTVRPRRALCYLRPQSVLCCLRPVVSVFCRDGSSYSVHLRTRWGYHVSREGFVLRTPNKSTAFRFRVDAQAAAPRADPWRLSPNEVKRPNAGAPPPPFRTPTSSAHSVGGQLFQTVHHDRMVLKNAVCVYFLMLLASRKTMVSR
jgi:hypothetical protein